MSLVEQAPGTHHDQMRRKKPLDTFPGTRQRRVACKLQCCIANAQTTHPRASETTSETISIQVKVFASEDFVYFLSQKKRNVRVSLYVTWRPGTEAARGRRGLSPPACVIKEFFFSLL
jgi:hypothetical protein